MKFVQIQAAINFQLEQDILLSVGNNIKKMQKNMKVSVQILNAPKAAPPEAPRIVVFSPNAILNISLNRYDIIINIPNHIDSILTSTLEYANNVIIEFLPYLTHENFHYTWTGIVVNSEKPFDTKNGKSIELITPYFDKLVNINRNDKKLSSFQLQYGIEENGFYKNFSISGYDKFNFQIPGADIAEGPIKIDLKNSEVTESGVQIIIDVNNKSMAKNAGMKKDFISLLNEIENIYKELPKSLNIEGLL